MTLIDYHDPTYIPDLLDSLPPLDAADPRLDDESPPSLVAIADNLASLGLRPENALRFQGYPHYQLQLELAAQYARVATHAQQQVGWSLDRIAWMGVIEAIGPLQAPYLHAVLHFLSLETIPHE